MAKLEAADVIRGCFFGFDSSGLRLSLSASGDFVHIRPAEDFPSGTAELEARLRDFLKKTTGANQTETLESLIELFLRDHLIE